jgi:hypothetical protein
MRAIITWVHQVEESHRTRVHQAESFWKLRRLVARKSKRRSLKQAENSLKLVNSRVLPVISKTKEWVQHSWLPRLLLLIFLEIISSRNRLIRSSSFSAKELMEKSIWSKSNQKSKGKQQRPMQWKSSIRPLWVTRNCWSKRSKKERYFNQWIIHLWYSFIKHSNLKNIFTLSWTSAQVVNSSSISDN